MCPSIDIINKLWLQYVNDNLMITIDYYKNISPFKEHPCGNDSLFMPVAGYIDPDIFIMYYNIREPYLTSIKILGHPWFICQFYRKKEILEKSCSYFDSLINEPQKKLRMNKKVNILNRVITKLLNQTKLNIEQVIRYIGSIYNMYKDVRVLHGYPIAVDSDNILCRFE